MQHCQQPIYATDSFCGECGETLNEKRSLNSPLDLHPELFSELTEYYPDATITTGKIISMDYYKRRYSSRNKNLLYGYWWLVVEDAQGQQFETSISAEINSFKDLKKGDVISLCSPVQCTLNYKVAYAEDRKMVKHNNFAPAIIVHNEQGQRSYIDGVLNAGDRPSSWLFLVTFFAVLLAAIFVANIPGWPAAGIALVCASICLVFELKRTEKLHQKDLARYACVQKTINTVLEMTCEDFGYHYHARAAKGDDVICIGCQQRISAAVKHCYRCGVMQKTTVLLEQSDSASRVATSQLEQEIAQHKPYSVADLQQQLMDQYSIKYSVPYTHKNVLAANETGEIQVNCIFAKVIDKVQKANVNHTQTEYTTTTRTDTYIGGTRTGSRYDTQVETYEARNSSLYGQLVIETNDYKVFKLSVAEDLLGSADVGDWIFYAESFVQMDDSRKSYREVAYNVSKDVMFNAQAVTEYGYTSKQWLVWLLFIIAAVTTFMFDRHDYMPLFRAMPWLEYNAYVDKYITYLPLALFAGFITVVGVWSSIYAMKNTKNQKRSVAKLYTLMAKFKHDIQQIKTQLKQLQ